MASSKKKSASRTVVKFRDLKSKKNPKGGLKWGIGSATGGAGAGKLTQASDWLKID